MLWLELNWWGGDTHRTEMLHRYACAGEVAKIRPRLRRTDRIEWKWSKPVLMRLAVRSHFVPVAEADRCHRHITEIRKAADGMTAPRQFHQWLDEIDRIIDTDQAEIEWINHDDFDALLT